MNFISKFFFLSISVACITSCISAPQSGNPFSQEMNRIDKTYKVTPFDSEEIRSEKEYLAGNARIHAMKSKENHRVYKSTVLRTTLENRYCSESRLYFMFEPVKCKAIYDYTVYVNLTCKNKKLTIKPMSQIYWIIGSKKGFATVDKSGFLTFHLKQDRVIKKVGGPPQEDPHAPKNFKLKIGDKVISVESKMKILETLAVPNSICI